MPNIPEATALGLVQHTHLSAHEHADDYLVYLTDIGTEGEAILGFLTRCWRCVDLWHVVPTAEQWLEVERVLKDAEDAGQIMWIERTRAAGERWVWWYRQAERVQMNQKSSMLRIRGTEGAPGISSTPAVSATTGKEGKVDEMMADD